MRLLLAALTPLALAVVSSTASAQCSDAERAKLEQMDRDWAVATQGGDRAKLANIYADDFMSVGGVAFSSKTQTIDDAVRGAERRRTAAQPAPEQTYDGYMITCTPLTAVITHRNTVLATVDGKETPRYSRSVHVLEKRAGRWQVVSTTGNALDDEATLMYMERDWNAAAKQRDVAWFERNYAAGAREISSRTGEMLNKVQAIAAVRDDKSTYETLDLSEMSARVTGDMAVVTGLNHLRGRDEAGKPFDRRVRFTDTFVRQDGRWLVFTSQGTTLPAPMTAQR